MKTRNKTKQQNTSESLENQGLLEVKFINTYIGSGVYAKSDIRKGTFICVYSGENISEEEGLHRLERNTQPGCYLYFYKKDGKRFCVDGTHTFGVGKYINDDHKKPNAKVKLEVVDGNVVLAVYALKDISQGNEIRYDYGDKLAHWRKKNAEPEILYAPPEAKRPPLKAQPSSVISCKQSADSIVDLQPQNGPSTLKDKKMESDSVAEMPPVHVKLLVTRIAEQQFSDSTSDMQPQDGPLTLRADEMEADSETEMSPVHAQTPMKFGSVEQYTNSTSDLPQDGPPTSRDEEFEVDSEAKRPPLKAQPSSVVSCKQSAESIVDLQPQNGPSTLKDKKMESDSVAEMPPVHVKLLVTRIAEQQFSDSTSDMQPQDGPLTLRADEMEADSETEMPPVHAWTPMTFGSVEQYTNSTSDLPQDGLPTLRDEEFEVDIEAESPPLKAQPSSVVSCKQSADSIVDLQPQNGPPSLKEKKMESDSVAEMPPVHVKLLVTRIAEQQFSDSTSDMQPQDGPLTSRDDEMEADSETEMPPVHAWTPMKFGSVEQYTNSTSDLPQDGPPTLRDEEFEVDSEAESPPLKAQPSSVVSCKQSADSIVDLQPQNGPPSLKEKKMESDSVAEMPPVHVQLLVTRIAEQQFSDSTSDMQPQDGPLTSRDDDMEADSETEMPPVHAWTPMTFGSVEQYTNSTSDLPQDGLPTLRDEEFEVDSEAESPPLKAQPSSVVSCKQSADSIVDLQPQNGPPTLKDKKMESDSIAEMPPVHVKLLVTRIAEQQFSDSTSDMQPQDGPLTSREMEADSEAETPRVHAQTPMIAGRAEQSVDSICCLQSLDWPLTLKQKGMESDSGDEVVDSALESDAGSEIWPVLCSGNIQISDVPDEFEEYDDNVLDPDYHPEEDSHETNSDYSNPKDDFGFQSDSFRAELIQSSSVTSSSDKDGNNIPVVTVEKRSSNLLKGQRDFKRKHTCFVCEKNVCDIPRHAAVAHGDDDLVKAALSKPKGSKERRALWKVFVNKGAYKANIRAKAVGGELRVSKRTGINRKPDEYQPCIYCYGYFLKKDLWRHTKNCNSSVFKGFEKKKNCIQSNIKAVSATVSSVSCATAGSKELLERFYDKMKVKDNAYIVVKQDRLLQLYTRSLIEEGKSHTDTSWTVRLLGKLLLKARDISTDTNLSWMELIDHVNWKILAAGIRSLAEFKYDQDKVTVGRANIGIKCGQGVRGLIAAFEGYALSVDDDFLLQKAKKMLMNYEKEWPKMQKRCRQSSKVHREDQEDNLLPLTDDIAKLRKYCVGQIHSLSSEMQRECDHQNYKQLQTLVLARLISFNARRGGEPGKLKITQWQSIYQGKGIHKEEISALPEEEKVLAERLRLGYVLGKGLKRVPVLFPDETVSAINILLKHRKSVISNPDNPYVFGRLRKNSVEYLRGSDCIKQICNEAGLQHSSLITATQLRKYLSTTLQLIDMTEAELRWITDHMGHSIDVHKRWYRMSHKTVELSKVASILVAAETGRLQKAHSIPFDDVHAVTCNEAETPPVHAQLQMSNSTSDLQSQDGLPISRDEEMEADSEAEMPPFHAQPPWAGSAKQPTDGTSDLQPWNRPLTPRAKEVESDNEAETLPIDEQPTVTLSAQESTGNRCNLQPRDKPPTSKEEGIKLVKEKKKKQIHKPWCREERIALFDAFSNYLVPKCRRLPGKREIMRVQDHSKALTHRTWQNIKYQLKNMQCKI